MKYGWLSLALIAFLGTGASADPLYKRTQVTFSVPFEIPGNMVLPAGTYVMKLLDPYTDNKVVQFYDRDQKHMYAMAFTIPVYRLQAPDHTVITFEERAGNSPQAIKEWIPAGDNWGEEFVYPKAHPAAVAETAPPPAPVKAGPAPVAPAPQRAAVAPVAPPATPAPRRQPVQIAQAQPAPARPTPTPAAPPTLAPTPKKELPKTASDLPLAVLIGGLLLAAGALLRPRSA